MIYPQKGSSFAWPLPSIAMLPLFLAVSVASPSTIYAPPLLTSTPTKPSATSFYRSPHCQGSAPSNIEDSAQLFALALISF